MVVLRAASELAEGVEFPGSQPGWWPHTPTRDAQAGSLPQEPLQPLGLVALEGLAVWDNSLVGLDRLRGYLVQMRGHNTILLNPHHVQTFQDAYGLCLEEDAEQLWIWLSRNQDLEGQILRIPLQALERHGSLQNFQVCTAPYPIEGIALWKDADSGAQCLYATCYQREKILRLDPGTGKVLQEMPAPGIGREQLAVRGDYLWVSDRIEETIYVLERQSGRELARILTPCRGPTGLTHWQEQLWVAYAHEEAFIHDNPNAPDPLSVALRDKTGVAPLRLRPLAPPPPNPVQAEDPQPLDRVFASAVRSTFACPVVFQPQRLGERATYTLSQGYRVELTYVEEIAQEEPRLLPDLIWRIALPCNSPRQRVRSFEPVGLPFQVEEQSGQQVAVFTLGSLGAHEVRLFGWRAVLDLYNIKYCIDPLDVEDAVLPMDLRDRYLVDDDDLAMHTPIVQEAARQAIGSETNLLRKMLNIRAYVYDKLSYRVTPRIDPPDEVLRRGSGSCGEYVGLLLALARLNGIPCRTVGRYKCPPHPEMKRIPLFPEYNHVWIEFYLPGWGWVPMESNPDDLGERPYPQRYFMGLPWTHAEIAKGIPFETINTDRASIGELAINHVQFRILEEL
ncbi:MAG: transglutaminase family protein [Thermostichus sp. HHBFW_bins_43]